MQCVFQQARLPTIVTVDGPAQVNSSPQARYGASLITKQVPRIMLTAVPLCGVANDTASMRQCAQH